MDKCLDLFFEKLTEIEKRNCYACSITLSHSKTIQVYYSKAYKEYVVSFNLGSKKFIITKKKWLYFRNFLTQIDNTIVNQ